MIIGTTFIYKFIDLIYKMNLISLEIFPLLLLDYDVFLSNSLIFWRPSDQNGITTILYTVMPIWYEGYVKLPKLHWFVLNFLAY